MHSLTGTVAYDDEAKKICNLLKEQKIPIKIYEYQPVYTVEDVKNAKLNIPGVSIKNLFLRDKKKKIIFCIKKYYKICEFLVKIL